MKPKSFRLSPDIIPVNYELFFDVDMEAFVFAGRETINLQIKKPVKEIVLHAADMNIGKVSLSIGKKTLKPQIKFQAGSEKLVLKFGEPVKGGANLTILFSAVLNDNLLGFHRNKYAVARSTEGTSDRLDGKEKYLATTQFEAPYARRAFPCFDEPEMKATFDVTMRIGKKLQALSNMPVKKETKEGSSKTIEFQRTPKMSTYLLYMGVGEFEFLEDRLGKTLIRLVTTRGKKNQAKFAMEMTKKSLAYFEKYSGIPYPLPKLDMIALPDFAAGAMENWGAVTFREIYLLFDPKKTSVVMKKRIAMIIAHELWHQWSGNLVTMKWWNDLWLNESFATYMAYKAVDSAFPEWKLWENFIESETDRAFDEDSLKSTHPIEVEVSDVHQIEEIFDAISYSKGGSVLRMLDNYLGEEIFRKGVSSYLNAHQYGNAASQDLWNHLERASKKPIKKMATSWVNQAGYPLVEAALSSKLSLQQRRFVFGNDGADAVWMIPLIIKTDEKVVAELLNRKAGEINIGNPQWFKANYGQAGFYRVRYSQEDLSKLKAIVSAKAIDAIDRWGIQNDLYKLCRNGEITVDAYLDFIDAYNSEDSYIVLSSVYGSMRGIHFLLAHEKFWSNVWPKFKSLYTQTFQRILEALGWDTKSGEDQKETLLRELAIRYLGFSEDPAVLKVVAEKFEAYSKGQSIDPNIRAAVFSITAAQGDEKIYSRMQELYLKTQVLEEKRALLIAMGQFRDPKIIGNFLDFSLTDKVRVQDIIISISSVAGNPYSRGMLPGWAEKNWKKLESYKKSGKIFIAMLESLISSHVRKEDEEQLRKFFAKRSLEYKMTLDRSFERVQRNISWREKNADILARYFK